MRRSILYAFRWSFCHVRHDESVLRPKLCGARELDCFKRSSFRRRVGSRIQVSSLPVCGLEWATVKTAGVQFKLRRVVASAVLAERAPAAFYAIPILARDEDLPVLSPGASCLFYSLHLRFE